MAATPPAPEITPERERAGARRVMRELMRGLVWGGDDDTPWPMPASDPERAARAHALMSA